MDSTPDLAVGLGGSPIWAYIAISAGLFVIGLLGVVFNRRSVVVTLASVEVMLFASAINLAAFSAALPDAAGHSILLGLFVITAAKSAVAVAIVITLQRNRGSIDVADMNLLRD